MSVVEFPSDKQRVVERFKEFTRIVEEDDIVGYGLVLVNKAGAVLTIYGPENTDKYHQLVSGSVLLQRRLVEDGS